jgi:molybdenum cofactor cytidylyltransferase
MSSDAPRLFALIPAAGRSRRMGRPKLLLPFGETTVIGRLISTLRAEHIADVLVLGRPDDAALADEVRRCGATVVQPETPPPEMRVSVEWLLDAVEHTHAPRPADGWLLIPADQPLIRPDTLRRLTAAWRNHPASIVLPVTDGRRGHPTIFPWPRAEQVRRLPLHAGVNHLLHDAPTPIIEVPVDDPTIHLDLDTPADYQQALSQLND